MKSVNFLILASTALLLFPQVSAAETTICGSTDSGHYFEIDNFNGIPKMQASAAWYVNGVLKQTKKIFPSSISSGSKVSIQIGGTGTGVSKTSSFTAGPIAMSDGTVIWATGSSDGVRQLIVTNTFDQDKISDSDLRITCAAGATAAGSGVANSTSR